MKSYRYLWVAFKLFRKVFRITQTAVGIGRVPGSFSTGYEYCIFFFASLFCTTHGQFGHLTFVPAISIMAYVVDHVGILPSF